MKALVKFAAGPLHLELREVPTPEPEAGQIRMKVVRSGICHTDLDYYRTGGAPLKPPVILGHEVAGIVDAVGEGVTAVKPGDRVLTQTTYSVCGKCRFCKKGQLNHCIARQGIGSVANGGFAEYLVNREESIMKLPDTVSFEEAAVVEPLACGVHALMERTNVCVDSVVVVLGPGAIGLLVAQVAKAQGAYVIMAGLTPDQQRLNLALELGIDRTVDIQKEDLDGVVKSYTENYGADIVVEATGARAAVDLGMKITAKDGVFIPMSYFPRSIEVDYYQIKQRELNVFGSSSQIPSSWPKALKLIANGKVNAKAVVSHVLPMSQWKEAFELVENKKGLKVMLDPSQ
ncbi:Sorbitol dehydrogenase [Propionispora sp. 2/2-37]|uniref:zinc-dependent alcohol dehydrogenase n=1 Tax=Propionispora sp. 2/2-37 TaxID=1677858 RepID=UPI0006BB6C86|nr:zinc-binding dehydrogenase [Propionispora sp. 2/2-37]CUH94930.1 Sorbitol dehydrogenase [Propionispora sp. 2/2-37]